ncbi:class II glutamine amidotransferase, partial [Ostertagia ostertagi]
MCGIIGLVQAEGVEVDGALSVLAADALTALQHRGTESAGLVGSDGTDRQHLDIVKGQGLARDVFVEEKLCKMSGSRIIIGHNRYSTAGKKRYAINCVQPFVVYTAIGIVAIAHNGELVDVKKKRKEVLHEGVGLSTDTDSELIAQMVAKAIALNYKCRSDLDWGDISKELAVTMSSLNMSYSLVVMTYDRLYAIRDPYGNRPLCVGTIYDNE